jgi:hypothetical protein
MNTRDVRQLSPSGKTIFGPDGDGQSPAKSSREPLQEERSIQSFGLLLSINIRYFRKDWKITTHSDHG